MNSVEKIVNNYVTHYNHKKYWSWKEKLTNHWCWCKDYRTSSYR